MSEKNDRMDFFKNKIRAFVEKFNADDEELYRQHIPNSGAADWMIENIPYFECPDAGLEEIYYFRWWTYRKHIKSTPDGFVITEFLPPVPWAGRHNTINCAAHHHIMEGRWLRDRRYLDDYTRFWLRGGGELRRYSLPLASAARDRALVTGDWSFAAGLLPELRDNYAAWEKEKLDERTGLFTQSDNYDGMEKSIGGDGCRATINSYMYGDAVALGEMLRESDPAGSRAFLEKARMIRERVDALLWDEDASFYKVLKPDSMRKADVRELHGYTPWYYNMPGIEKASAWRFLSDPRSFSAPFGLTTAEQNHPGFAVSYEGHECQWNGPVWPFATSTTLTAMANLLNGPPQDFVGHEQFFSQLMTYAKSHHRTREDGRTVCWIDENINPFDGDWISRTRLKTWDNGGWDMARGGVERGKDYNHSTFCDLVINCLLGVRPQPNGTLKVNPLVPEGKWDYFRLTNLTCAGKELDISFDRAGERYKRGKGLVVDVR